MEVVTPRFGTLKATPSDILLFESGLIGLRRFREWIVLADAQNPMLAWLQNIEAPEIALGVVSPWRFVPNYRFHAAKQDLELIGATAQEVQVLVIVSRHTAGLAINLRAPLLVNVEKHRGCQVVAQQEFPVRMMLAPSGHQRRSA